MNNEKKSGNSINLRQKAENLLKKTPGEKNPHFSEADNLKLIHELEVHQIELEMQNEELVSARSEALSIAEKYTELYDFAPMGYFTLSKSGDILEINLCASQMIGKDRRHLKNSQFHFFVSDETKPVFNLFLDSIFEDTVKRACEVTLLKSDKTEGPIYLTGIAVEKGEFCFITMVDVSQQKKMEDGLQKIQKLQSLGILAGGIAHNFNNLLSGIFGYIDLAYESSTEKQVKSYLSEVLSNIDRARGLTQQLLTFAKGGAPVKKLAYMQHLLKETVQFALSGSNVSCSFDISDDLMACNLDRSQIEQVIDNLVINARQSMPAGGTIQVSAQNLTFAKDEHPPLAPGDYIKISIKDFGTGISKEVLPRIFDPYFTTNTTGNGLGLTTSFSIISRHEGSIDVSSEIGKGTFLNVYLPASGNDVILDKEKSTTKYKGKGVILVMDDDEVILTMITKMLASMGHEIICKSNGRDAVDFLKDKKKTGRKIVGMILDLTIPGGMGGAEAVSEIRKFDADIPVFVASGHCEDPVMTDPKAYGFTASISKPFRLAELSEMLKNNLHKDC